MFDPDAGASGEWVVIGGQLTGDLASTVALLDMTNKDSGGVAEFLEGIKFYPPKIGRKKWAMLIGPY